MRARELNEWAKSPQAKVLLPELVGRLVRATVPKEHLLKCDFASEAEAHRPDYDGTTVTSQGTLHVPPGIGYWELGCDARPEQKAQGDYDTRIKEHEQRVAAGETDDIHEATFIAVTARDWHKKKHRSAGTKSKATKKSSTKTTAQMIGMVDWAKARSAEKRFKEVIAYDSSTLEQWMREAPPVALWLAKQIGKQINGVQDVASHWSELQAAMRKPLPPGILLVSRSSTAEAFRNWYAGEPRELAVRAPSGLEVVAVFAAWVHTLSADQAAALSARAIIVEDRNAWRELTNSIHPLVLVASPKLDADRELFSAAASKGHWVLRDAETRSPNRGSTIELERMRRFDLQQALQAAGLQDAEARQLAQGSGGNFTILRRIFAREPEVGSPAWAKEPVLAGLLLAGAWEDQKTTDQQIVARLCDKHYSDARVVAAKWSAEEDAPLRLVLKDRGTGKTWEFLSPLDAWESLRWELNPSHLAAFEEVAVEVFSEDNPALSLPPNERLLAGVKGKTWKYSHHLRQGLAEILAIGATREDETEKSQELGFAIRAARIVERILPPRCSWQRWASLGELLSSLIEAAPDVVLTAIERDLQTGESQVIELLRQEIPTGALGGAAYHSGLLWALETAAWKPEHVPRVTLILGDLTERDPPDVTWSNRPLSSAARIFFSWRPQTMASVGERVDALQLLARQRPGAAWKIVLASVPHPHGMFIDSSKPTYRDWAAGWTGEVSVADYATFISAVASIAVELALADATRWSDLLDDLAAIRLASGDAYEQIRENFATFLSGEVPEELKDALWRKLSDFVHKHQRGSGAAWALPAEEVARFAALRDSLNPADPVVRLSYLFDNNGWADLDESLTYEQKAERRSEQRRTAIREIFAQGGIVDTKRLTERVQQPWGVGWSLSEELATEPLSEIVPELLTSPDKNLAQMARAYAAHRVRALGASWAEAVPQASWSPDQIALWGVQMDFVPATWDWIGTKGDEVKRLYWLEVNSWGGSELELSDAIRAVGQFQAVGRAWDALQFLVVRQDVKRDENAELICEALETAAHTPQYRQVGTMDAHYVREALSFLQDQSSGTDETRVAALEFAFLPLLDHHFLLPKTLQRRLARDPQFFIECLSLLYRPRGVKEKLEEAAPENSERTEEEAERAQRIWRLLREWETIPASDQNGAVDGSALSRWVAEARALARENGYVEVADVHLGQVFAKSKEDTDGGVPLRPIREIIDATKSEDIERGFIIGLHNLRGVFSKALYEGGEQERALADKYERYAEICKDYPRTAKALRAVAKDYLRQAREEDERAKSRG